MKPNHLIIACGIFAVPFSFCNPLQAQNALLNEGATIYVQSAASLYIQGTLENKTTGNFSNAGVVYTSGNLIHNGSVNLNAVSTGIFRFNGTGNQVISGSKQPNFYNFTLDKSAGEVQLQTGISVSNLLTFTSGSLFLNNQQVDLLTSGILTNETATNKIYDLTAGTGTVKIIRTLNAPSAVNPGNLGATITTSQNLGSTTIIRGHTAQFIVTASSIKRYYTITPTTNTGLNATLRFNYFDSELNGQIEDDLVQWHLPNGSVVWLRRGGTVSTGSNYVNLTAIDSFKTMQSLLSSKVVGLPLHLLEFTATKITGGKVLLVWRTEEEVNSSHFEIERSNNGVQWTKIGAVSTTGQRSITQAYRFTDQSPFNGHNYYRLKQLDIDGQFDYSPVRLISFTNNASVLVYPTITKGRTQMFVGGISPEKVSVEIYDNKGSQVYKTKMYSNSFLLPQLSSGIYHVKLINITDHSVAGTTQIVIY